MGKNDVMMSGDNPGKPRSNGTDFIKGAWRRARYLKTAIEAAGVDTGNAAYHDEGSGKSFDERYNIKSSIEYLESLKKDELKILDRVLKNLKRENVSPQVLGAQNTDQLGDSKTEASPSPDGQRSQATLSLQKTENMFKKLGKVRSRDMWLNILERSCDSRRKAINLKLGRLISDLPTGGSSQKAGEGETTSSSQAQSSDTGLLPPGGTTSGGHDNQKQKYTVEEFAMPIFSRLTLPDLQNLANNLKGENNHTLEGQNPETVLPDDNGAKEDPIETAAKALKSHVERLYRLRIEEHGLLGYLAINNPEAINIPDKLNARHKNRLEQIKKEYEDLKKSPCNELLERLASSQGEVLLASPGWAGFARQFERTYKPETVFAKFLSMLPESTVRSPRRAAATLAALSPFGVGAAGVAAGVGIGAAGVAVGVGIGAAGVAAGVGIPLAGVYYGGKGILSLSARANKALRIWNEARKEELEDIKNLRIDKRDEVQDIKKKNKNTKNAIQIFKKDLASMETLSEGKKKQIEQIIIDLECKYEERRKKKNSFEKDLRRLKVMSWLKGVVGTQNTDPLIPHGFFEEDSGARRSSSQSPSEVLTSQDEVNHEGHEVHTAGDGASRIAGGSTPVLRRSFSEPVRGSGEDRRTSLPRSKSAAWRENREALHPTVDGSQRPGLSDGGGSKHRESTLNGGVFDGNKRNGESTGAKKIKALWLAARKIFAGKGGWEGGIPWISKKLKNQRLAEISPRAELRSEAGDQPQEKVEKRRLRSSKDISERVGAHTLGHHVPNEDAHFFDAEHKCYGVFDGVSGNRGGHKASEIAKNFIQQELKDNMSDDIPIEDAKRILKEILEGAHQEIKNQQKNGEYPEMLTTASVVKIMKDGTAVIGNVGDSRVYLLKKGEQSVEQLTLDDGHLSGLWRSGLYTQEKAQQLQKQIADIESFDNPSLSPEIKHAIEKRSGVTQALGDTENNVVEPNIYTYRLNPGDTLILATDGIHDNLTDKRIAKCILEGRGNNKKAAESLIKRARKESKKFSQKKEDQRIPQRPKPDDMTAIVVKFSGEGINHTQTSDSGPQAEISSTSSDRTMHEGSSSKPKNDESMEGPSTEIEPQIAEQNKNS